MKRKTWKKLLRCLTHCPMYLSTIFSKSFRESYGVMKTNMEWLNCLEVTSFENLEKSRGGLTHCPIHLSTVFLKSFGESYRVMKTKTIWKGKIVRSYQNWLVLKTWKKSHGGLTHCPIYLSAVFSKLFSESYKVMKTKKKTKWNGANQRG